MTAGTVGIQGFGRTRRLELPDGTNAPVSPLGRAALRYSPTSMAIEVSIDGTAYVALSTGGGGASPWVDDGAGNVRLQVASNDVVVGAAATIAGEKMRVVGDVRIDDGTNDYLLVETAGGSEELTFGNTTTNPDYVFLGSGNVVATRIDRAGFINIGEALCTSLRLGRSIINTIVQGSLSVQGTITTVNRLNIVEQGADPTGTANIGKVYTREASARTELFYVDDTGAVVQITSGGSLVPPSSFTSATFNLPDNTAGAFVIQEGTNPYLTINTTNSSELVQWGTTAMGIPLEYLTYIDSNNVNAHRILEEDSSPWIVCDTSTPALNLGNNTGLGGGPVQIGLFVRSQAQAFRVVNQQTGRNHIVLDTALNNYFFGNATDNPTFTVLGTGAMSLGGPLFANGGVDRSAAAALALAPANATSVTVGALANPITAAVTIPDNTASAWLIRDAAGLSYMDITTTNAGEFVGFGNTTTAPNYFFQGASITMGVGSDASGSVEAAAFGPGALFGFSRAMTVGTAVQATSITMGHGAAPLTVNSNAVTVSEADVSLGITNNAASSFLVVDPVTGNNYVDITTTTGAETVAIGGSTNPDVTIDTTGAILVGQTGGTWAVLGGTPQARAAAYTVTNPVDTRAFDTTTVTVDALAEVVGTMIADLQGFGLFG